MGLAHPGTATILSNSRHYVPNGLLALIEGATKRLINQPGRLLLRELSSGMILCVIAPLMLPHFHLPLEKKSLGPPTTLRTSGQGLMSFGLNGDDRALNCRPRASASRRWKSGYLGYWQPFRSRYKREGLSLSSLQGSLRAAGVATVIRAN